MNGHTYLVHEKQVVSNFLESHLNVAFLRPESAFWDAIASTLISKFDVIHPSLDLGSGNGIFSFITSGGSFSLDYDWYINTDTEGFFENKDIYDVCKDNDLRKYITRKPEHTFTYALDHKDNLLSQAGALNFYDNLILHDANSSLPFGDCQLKTVFSNILYWLDNPQAAFSEVYRILDLDGTAFLCLPDKKFFEYCISYQWEKRSSELLRLLNRGRAEHMHWAFSYDEYASMFTRTGFTILHHYRYLSPLTLMVWDIGLRPLSPVLIKMANKLSSEERKDIKKEWIEICMKLLLPLYEEEQIIMDLSGKKVGGFNFFVLRK